MVAVLPAGCAGVTSPTLYLVYPFILRYPPSIETSKFCSLEATPGVFNKSIEFDEVTRPPSHATV